MLIASLAFSTRLVLGRGDAKFSFALLQNASFFVSTAANWRETLMASAAQDSCEIELVGNKWPLIPPGTYWAKFLHHETVRLFGAPKVFLHFEIVTYGEWFGSHLFAAYNARELIGKSRKKGRFKLGRRSDLYLTLCRLNFSRNRRPDRPSLSCLRDALLSVKIRTVCRDYRQRRLPVCEKYSVVDDILAIEGGTC